MCLIECYSALASAGLRVREGLDASDSNIAFFNCTLNELDVALSIFVYFCDKTIGPAGPFGFWSDVKLLLCLHLRISFDLVVVVWKLYFAVRFQCTSCCEVSQE